MLYVYVGLSELSLCAQEAMQCPTRHPVHLLHVHSDPPSGFRELVASLSLCPPPTHLQQSALHAARPGGSSNVRPLLGTAPSLTAGRSSLSTR